MAAGLSQEYDHTRQGSDKEDQKHWSIDDNDVTSVFLKYQLQADVIPVLFTKIKRDFNRIQNYKYHFF